MEYTVYSDFACAECYGLNEQLAALGRGATVRWRGVQIEPSLGVPMRPLDRRALDRLEDEIGEVRRRQPGIVAQVPRGRPNTRRAIVAVAAVTRRHPTLAALLRDALFRAYWCDGADLSSAGEVLRVARIIGIPEFVELDHPDAEELADGWDVEWVTERLGGVPRVIRSDGRILWGLKPLAEAQGFFAL